MDPVVSGAVQRRVHEEIATPSHGLNITTNVNLARQLSLPLRQQQREPEGV